MTPINGSLGNYPHTREGIDVTYHCNEGFRPSSSEISTCTDLALWIPEPEEHNCTLITGI